MKRTWQGRGVGAVSGVVLGTVVAEGAATGPDYIDDPKVGVPVAIAAGLLAFGLGVVWDRRAAQQQAELDRRQRWDAVFRDGPGWSPGTDTEVGVLHLLDAAAAVVPFGQAHLRHVTAIRRWCIDKESGRVWLLAGGPGTGKSRTAMRVAANLRQRSPDGWDCGWVLPGAERGRQAVEVAADWPRPVLIIVDDADLRDDLPDLLSALQEHQDREPGRVRVLLIAREFGGWWAETLQRMRTPVDTAAQHTWLGPLADTLPYQNMAVRRACAAFAAHLNVADVDGQVPVTGVSTGTPALLLHAAALEAVLQGGDGVSAPLDVGDAVDDLLDRERERWWVQAARHHLTRVSADHRGRAAPTRLSFLDSAQESPRQPPGVCRTAGACRAHRRRPRPPGGCAGRPGPRRRPGPRPRRRNPLDPWSTRHQQATAGTTSGRPATHCGGWAATWPTTSGPACGAPP